MPLMKTLLMLSYVGSSLLLASCATPQIAGDSYCQVYLPIIQSRGDSAISAPLEVKRRILFNEKNYRAECKK